MRILLTGATGFVGAHLGEALAQSHDVLGIAWSSSRRPDFETLRADLTEPDAARSLLRDFLADLVIHAAAISRVIDCEAQPSRAEELNVHCTKRLAEQSAATGARLFFFSSDMIFPGDTGYYTEQDNPSPRNVYGWTKLRAEKAVLEANSRNLVIRLNLVVGKAVGLGTSFTDRILADIQTNGKAALFEDQFRSPIHVRSVVSAVRALLKREISGILHLGGPQRLSRAEIGKALFRATGIEERKLQGISYLTHPNSAILPRDTSFARGRRESEIPELNIQPIEQELAMDFRGERTLT
jgi:dTDP-4-dehydrorhamnose reductase